MINNNSIITEIRDSVATLWLNRPHKSNAIDGESLSELRQALHTLNQSDRVRIIVIRGKGKAFCAGADLNWMQQAALLSEAENLRECQRLAQCFYDIYTSRKITIAIIHGTCKGGGNGFSAACDMSFASENSKFAFSEVKIGLVPAVIAPYIMNRAGRGNLAELLLSGRDFNALEAFHYGLINGLFEDPKEECFLSALLENLLVHSAVVQNSIKSYLLSEPFIRIDASVVDTTASLLAKTRIASEAREGIGSFLEKRAPHWSNH